MVDVGEIVTVIDKGKTYCSYEYMAQKLKSSNWARGKTPDKYTKARVLAIHTTLSSDKIALIEMEEGDNIGKQYVIGVDGLKGTRGPQCISLWEI